MAFNYLNNLTVSHLKFIVQYSGRGPYHFGSYHSCIDESGMDYYLINLGIKNQAGAAFPSGICMPKQCTPNQI